MLDKVKYINHTKEEIIFGINGIYINQNDLRDYSYKLVNNDFNYDFKSKKIQIMIVKENKLKSYEKRNEIYNIIDKDVALKTPGRFYINDYYLSCYITASSKKSYLLDERYILLDLEVLPQSKWIREKFISYRTDGKVYSENNEEIVIGSSKNWDMNYDYPYDFAPPLLNKILMNETYFKSDFKVSIFGPVDNPQLQIGDNFYKVNIELQDSEVLTIDSKSKTITKIDRRGTTVNVFKFRDRDHYIFQQIPPGDNKIKWSGTFGFDVVMYEERSEPKWI